MVEMHINIPNMVRREGTVLTTRPAPTKLRTNLQVRLAFVR